MGRLARESLVRNGVVGLALAIAAGLALFNLVSAIVGLLLVTPLQKLDFDYAFRIGGVVIQWGALLTDVLVAAAVVLGLWWFWKLAAALGRTCPDCRSEIPADASVCAFCTTELGPST